jgi:hypothetical protein
MVLDLSFFEFELGGTVLASWKVYFGREREGK